MDAKRSEGAILRSLPGGRERGFTSVPMAHLWGRQGKLRAQPSSLNSLTRLMGAAAYFRAVAPGISVFTPPEARLPGILDPGP